MSGGPERLGLDARIEAAADELRQIILERYPDAAFELVRAVDEPENLHLLTTVATDDLDEVLALVIDRVVDFQIAGIPIHVIPLDPPERTRASLGLQRQITSSVPLFPALS